MEKGLLGCVSVHYESESNPDHRNQQTQRLMELLVKEYGTVPVIGGDLNITPSRGFWSITTKKSAGSKTNPPLLQLQFYGNRQYGPDYHSS